MATDTDDTKHGGSVGPLRSLGRTINDLAEAMDETETSLLARRVDRLEREFATLRAQITGAERASDG